MWALTIELAFMSPFRRTEFGAALKIFEKKKLSATLFDFCNIYRTRNSDLQTKTEAVQCEDRSRRFGQTPLTSFKGRRSGRAGKIVTILEEEWVPGPTDALPARITLLL